MTLADFRKDKTLMREASKLKETPVFQVMLDVIQAEYISFLTYNSAGLAGDDKTLRLGQIEGYNLCQQTLLNMFKPLPKPRREPEAKFAAPTL